MLKKTCNDRNSFETTKNNMQNLFCNEKNNLKDDMSECDMKCMENNKMDFTNTNWMTLINSNKNYEQLNKYQNIENIEVHSHTNYNVQAINSNANYNRLVTYFDKSTVFCFFKFVFISPRSTLI